MKRKLLLVSLSCCFLLTSCGEKKYVNHNSQSISNISVVVNQNLTIKGKKFEVTSYTSIEYGEPFTEYLGGTLKIEINSKENGEIKKVEKDEYRLTTTFYTVQMNITGMELDDITKEALLKSIETSVKLSTEDTKKFINGEIVEVQLEEDSYPVYYILVDEETSTFKKR